jgi:hypothetical protein
MIKKYFNTTNGPVVISDDQVVVAGGDWAELESADSYVKKAVDNGWLVVVKEPEPPKEEKKPTLKSYGTKADGEVKPKYENFKSADKDKTDRNDG